MIHKIIEETKIEANNQLKAKNSENLIILERITEKEARVKEMYEKIV